MADREKQDYAQRDLDSILQEARSASSGLDARKALEILVARLKGSQGYYRWAPLGEGSETTWQIRIPRNDLGDEAWLKDEASELIHLCNPIGYLEATERRDKEGSSDNCGYVREGKCMKCQRAMPEHARKKGEVQLKLHTLGRKR